MLGWYDAIVASVTGVAAGEPPSEAGAAAFEALRDDGRAGARLGRATLELPARGRLERGRDDVRRHRDDRGDDRERSLWHLPHVRRRRRRRDLYANAVEESLRLEPPPP